MSSEISTEWTDRQPVPSFPASLGTSEGIRRPVASSIYLTADRNAEYIPPMPNGPDAA